MQCIVVFILYIQILRESLIPGLNRFGSNRENIKSQTRIIFTKEK